MIEAVIGSLPARIWWMASLAAISAIASATAVAVPAPDPREIEIRRHMDDLGRLWETGDRAKAEPYYADDFVDIAMDGVRRGKDEVLAFIGPAASPEAQINFAPSEHRFTFPGPDLALVTYRNRDCRDRPEGRRCFDFTASETFVRRAGRWALVAGQQSRIPGDPGDARAAVLGVEQALRAAQLGRDPALIEQLHAPEYRLILGDGREVSREKWLSDVRTGSWKPNAIAYSEQKVEIVGQTAIVVGVARSDWTGKDGKAEFARERYTDVYAERYGRWRKVSTHLSCLEGGC